MEHTNNKWDSLSMHERAKYIKLALDNGVSDLSMVRNSFNLYANGGNIHIKSENKGKFTELKERTGKSSTWYKENGTPTQKKMATFALNAAKWSHKHDGTSGTQELNIPVYTSSFGNTPTVAPFDITSSHQQYPEEWKDVGRISYDVARLLPITDRITDFIDMFGYSPSYNSPLSDGEFDFLNLTDLANALGYTILNPISNTLQKIGDDDVTLKNIFVDPSKSMKIIGKIDKVGDVAQLINDVYQISKKYKAQENKEDTLSETYEEGGDLLNNQSYDPAYDIPTIENGFEDWSKKYLGVSYALHDKDIQNAQDYLNSLKKLSGESDGESDMSLDLKQAQEDLDKAIKSKQVFLDYIYNRIVNANTGEPIKSPIKNILYRIMAQNASSPRFKSDIMAAINQQIAGMPVFLRYTGGIGSNTVYGWDDKNRDLNRLYLTGENSSLEELPKNSRGFTYSDYLKKTGYNPKTYKGEILPNEIVIDPKYASAVYNLIGKHTYTSGFDIEKQDNVARYIQKVGVSPEGNLEIQASDIWDFYPGDWKNAWGFGNVISNIGSRILDKIGHPFVLRDYAPIKFGESKNNECIPWLIDLPAYESTDSDGTPVFSLPEYTITADSETGENIKSFFGSASYNFEDDTYDTESTKWYIENSSNKHKSTKNLKNNNKAQGGYLNNLTTKPFSYKPIPVVRYEEGGFLDKVANVLNGWFNSDEDTQSDGIDMEELAARQAYAESRYKSNAQSGAGARGLFQIMPSVLSDYNLKNNANYTVDDLYNDTINSQIRNWYFEDLMNRGWNTKNNPSDSIRVAKALAAYNYGSGNVVNQLNKAKAAGVDIYNGWGWLVNMPKETRDYVNFVLRNQNSSLHRNNAAYSVSKEANKDKVKLIKEGK